MSKLTIHCLSGLLAIALIGPVNAADQAKPAADSTQSALPKIADAVDPKQDTEPARVNSINFYGNTKVTTAALMQGIGIQIGQVMKQELMGKAMDSIVAAYKAKGLDVQVRPRVSHPKQNFVDVNFLINEQGTGGHD